MAQLLPVINVLLVAVVTTVFDGSTIGPLPIAFDNFLRAYKNRRVFFHTSLWQRFANALPSHERC